MVNIRRSIVAIALSLGAVSYNQAQFADIDGDGIADVSDNCPALANPLQANADGDRLGDLCDSYVDRHLFVRAATPRYVLATRPALAEFRLENEAGVLQDDLTGVRFTATASASAQFAFVAQTGVVIDGAGTNQVVGEFVSGLFSIELADTQFESSTLSMIDSAGLGLESFESIFENFDVTNGGFEHSGINDSWSWGKPQSGPRSAYSGERVWATNLTDRTPHDVDASLVTQEVWLRPGTNPSLSFAQWTHLESGKDFVSFEINESGKPGWSTLIQFNGDARAWAVTSQPLNQWIGSTVRFRFHFTSNATIQRQGFYLDDFQITGLAPVIGFLDPDADPDGDGLSNRRELEIGTDHLRVDTDLDGLTDDRDNCPLIHNPDQSDTVSRNGIGDVCDDTDVDGASDRVDNCPLIANPDQSNPDFDPFGDRCDNCPLVSNFDQLDTIHAGNGVGDACDDPDGDAVADLLDNCADVANVDQANGDADPLGDACDNCPTITNQNQSDRVHPGNGIGDACDDPDGDGVPDLEDNCADLASDDRSNRDGDALGDPCDPYPDLRLVLRPYLPRYQAAGRETAVTYRLEDVHGNALHGFSAIRARLTLGGPAIFNSISEGRIVEGEGSSSVLVEFDDGRATVSLQNSQPGVVFLDALDVDRIGLEIWNEYQSDFEQDQGGFTSAQGEPNGSDPWRWGTTDRDTTPAHSGERVWKVRLPAVSNVPSGGYLYSPIFELDPHRLHELEFAHWFRTSTYFPLAKLQMRLDRSGGFDDLEFYHSPTPSWEVRKLSLDASGTYRSIQFRFAWSPDSGAESAAWLLDDLRFTGVSSVIEFLDPNLDLDNDSLPNSRELELGTDPHLADSDNDQVLDWLDNCPTTANIDQRDLVHPGRGGDACEDRDSDSVSDLFDNCPDAANTAQFDRDRDLIGDECDNCPTVSNSTQEDMFHRNGIGDACDDPDQDGIADDLDLCPDQSIRSDRDTDGDGLGDGCDPHPSVAYVIRLAGYALGFTDQTAWITLTLEDELGSPYVTAGIRATIRLSSPAVFGDAARDGVLLSGSGTAEALIEFVNGRATFPVICDVATSIALTAIDSERVGIRMSGDVFENFERDAGGLKSEKIEPDSVDPWEWGSPSSGPQSATSGIRVWGTTLAGDYSESASGVLVTPWFKFPGASLVELRFSSWFERSRAGSAGRATAVVELQTSASAEWQSLISVSAESRWTQVGARLSEYSNRSVRLRFRFTNFAYYSESAEETGAGWYIDDLRITGLEPRVQFVERTDDSDADGLGNEQELLLGTDPFGSDSDEDGIADGIDNCPLVANSAQSDRYGSATRGDACEDSDGDGVVDAADNCPQYASDTGNDSDGDGLGDACDRFPQLRLRARISAPRNLVLGQAAPIQIRLENATGKLQTDLSEVRLTLVGSESVRFSPSPGHTLIAGENTNRAVIEIQSGLASLQMRVDEFSRFTLFGEDAGRDAVDAFFEVARWDFERDDGAALAFRPWKWTTPPEEMRPGAEGHHVYWNDPKNPLVKYENGALGTPHFGTRDLQGVRVQVRSWFDGDQLSTGAIRFQRRHAESTIDLGHVPLAPRSWETLSYLVPDAEDVWRVLFVAFPGADDTPSWAIDEVEVTARQFGGSVDTYDSDGDYDHLTLEHELESGLDPQNSDTDWDGVPDDADNCPATPNSNQSDALAPFGIGDACVDTDGDGRVDSLDRCPTSAELVFGDRDRDLVGDSCDPFPDRVLVVQPSAPLRALQGEPIEVEFELQDDTGRIRADLTGLQTTLIVEGGGVFDSIPLAGRILSGGSTDRVLVEFVNGYVRLKVDPQSATQLSFAGLDSERIGIVVPHDLFADFESGHDGFVESHEMPRYFFSPPTDHWGHGTTPHGNSPVEGQYLFHTFASGGYPNESEGVLVAPAVWIPRQRVCELSYRSWRSEESSAYIVLKIDDSWRWYELAYAQVTGRAWTDERVSLRGWGGSWANIGFSHRNYYSLPWTRPGLGWQVDDVRISGLSTIVELFLPNDDDDLDGLTNRTELQLGSDPRSQDTDGDAALDGLDNCVLETNAEQLDAIHPGGKGDACDDPDEDGVADVIDLCPDAHDPANLDQDVDGIGDLCDTYPQLRLKFKLKRTWWALAGGSTELQMQLVDQFDRPHPELTGIAVTLRLTGSARFGDGSHEQRVDVIEGIVRVTIANDIVEIVRLTSEDTDRLGIEPLDQHWEPFEESDGGSTVYTSSPEYSDAWGWASASEGSTKRAHSGDKIWTLTPRGAPTRAIDSTLNSRKFEIPLGSTPQIEFASWYAPESRNAYRSVTLSGGNLSRTVGGFNPPSAGWQIERIASTVGGPFLSVSWSYEGEGFQREGTWAIDSLRISAVAPAILFLNGAADIDNDGLTNAEEIARGSHPYSRDTDGDLRIDGDDNCLLVSNADQADLVVPGGGGDACSDADADGTLDRDDLCPLLIGDPGEDPDGDRRGNACDPYPELALFARPVSLPIGVLTGMPQRLEFVLEDQFGVIRAELEHVRVTLAVNRAAVFENGASQIQIEFVNGRAAAVITDQVAETVRLNALDTEQLGIAYGADYVERFDGVNGGFTSRGRPSGWKFGTPTTGPQGGYTGSTVWGTPYDAPLAIPIDAELRGPLLRAPETLGTTAIVHIYGNTQQGVRSYVSACLKALAENNSYIASGCHYTFTPEVKWHSVAFFISSGLKGLYFRPVFGVTSQGTDVSGESIYFDDLRIRDIYRELRFFRPDDDNDADRVTNAAELRAGSEPNHPDPDGDGVDDSLDNCPLTYNPTQRDAVRPGGHGDSCADDDRDGVVDLEDLCLEVADPLNSDRDADLRGDACDPFPDLAITIEPVASRFAVAGEALTIVYRLIGPAGEQLDKLEGVQATLTLSGSARFAATARQGRLIQGGGTGRVLVEFERGLVVIDIADGQREGVTLGGEDSQGLGVSFGRERRFDFESSEQGFSHHGEYDPWRHTVPAMGPMAAHSGRFAMAAIAAGSEAREVDGTLVSPPIELNSAGRVELSLYSWLFLERSNLRAGLDISSDGGQHWASLTHLPRLPNGWELLRFDISDLAGRTVSLRFTLKGAFDYYRLGDAQWFFDDVVVRGLLPNVEFVDPDADPDNDGLTNRQEILLGTGLLSADSDLDGVADIVDNCPIVSNADQRDRVHVNGVGDDCDDPDADGVSDRFDGCPDTPDPAQLNLDLDRYPDACDNCPSVWNPGQRDSDGDSRGDACQADPGRELAPGRAWQFGFVPDDVAFDKHAPRLYAVDRAASRIVSMSLESGLIEREWTFEFEPVAISLTPSGERLFISLQTQHPSRFRFDRLAGRHSLIATFDTSLQTRNEMVTIEQDPFDIAALDERHAMVSPASGWPSYSRFGAFDTTTGATGEAGVWGGTRATLSMSPDGRRVYSAFRLSIWIWDFEVLSEFRIDEDPFVNYFDDGLDWLSNSALSDHRHVAFAAGNLGAVSGGGEFFGRARVDFNALPLVQMLDVAAPVVDLFNDESAQELWLIDQAGAQLYDANTMTRLVRFSLPGKPLFVGRHGRTTYVINQQSGGRSEVQRLVYNHAPVAELGDNRVVECQADERATVVLDGSASRDADHDSLSFSWTEEDRLLADSESATITLANGLHPVVLTVKDELQAFDQDQVSIEVVDTIAPAGGVTAPAPGSCFGPAAAPIVIHDDFSDRCSTVSLSYLPFGPSFSEHGDVDVIVTGTDRSGNSTSSHTNFTIDKVAPLTSVSIDLKIISTDDDGAAGGVLHEQMYLDGCLLYDGATYGDGDGLLSDESLSLDHTALCRAALLCGVTQWNRPLIRIEARDCGDNLGVAERRLPGKHGVKPGTCP